jgi:hypothetical protein
MVNITAKDPMSPWVQWRAALATSPPTSSTRFTVAVGCTEVLSPILCDTTLRRTERHPSGLDLVSQVVLYPILDLEIATIEHRSGWPALWPNVSHAIGSTEF